MSKSEERKHVRKPDTWALVDASFSRNEAKVLVLYTGGTIGMVRNKEGSLEPIANAMESKISSIFTMHDEAYAKKRFGGLEGNSNGSRFGERSLPLVLPHVPKHRRVVYTIYEYDPLLDSSNMTMDDYVLIANDVHDAYEAFDGFVVLHGTDTLAYTASALSFMLRNLGKPVIVTGSQIPLFEVRSDGRDNFVGALILAGNYNIPEVGVYFRHQLMRGNRTVKVSSGQLSAFESPNMVPLVRADIDIHVDYKSIHKSTGLDRFSVHTKLNTNVVLLRIFPSIRAENLAHFLKPPIEGVVLQCYGAGNVPSNRSDMMELLKNATERGVIVVSVTQCSNGGVSGAYATGKALLDVGVIPGADMTPEAALTKLAYVLSRDDLGPDEKRKMMRTNIAGEMTVLQFVDNVSLAAYANCYGAGDEDDEDDLILAVAKSLQCKTSGEMENLRHVLFPSILCAAVHTGMASKLETLRTKYNASMSACDYDKRSPLHVAASDGKLDIVEYLMRAGASVHMRDRNGDTPLACAVKGCHRDVVRALVACGAHLSMGSLELGEQLCHLARLGEKKKLSCYKLAGANLNSTNLSRQTALHSAVETNRYKIVQFLLENQADVNRKDHLGQTPIDIARALQRTEILAMMEKYVSSNEPANVNKVTT